MGDRDVVDFGMGALPFSLRTVTMAGSAEGAVSEMAKAEGPGAVKPGWTTTEFWQTVFVHVVAGVVALGTVIHTDFNLNGLQAIVPTIALVASALAQSVYSHSRATVKSSAQKAEAEMTLVGATGATGVSKPARGEPAPIVIRLTGMEPVQTVGGNGERPVAGG